jgi:flagellar biosynthesis protein FliR
VDFQFTTWFLVFTRVGALLVSMPIFSTRGFPVQLRVALAALLAFILLPVLPAQPVDTSSLWALIRVMFVEVSIGVLLGFVCRFLFFALEFAGGLIATEMGLMLPSEFNQLIGSSSMAPATLLYWLAAMLFFSLDLHHWMIAGFQHSYAVVPMGGAHLSEALLVNVISRSGKIFVIALQIAAPVMAVSFLITLVFSVLSRAVPQMNVFAESFSVRTLAGLLTFGLTCTFMAQHIANYLHRLPDDMMNVARLMAG